MNSVAVVFHLAIAVHLVLGDDSITAAPSSGNNNEYPVGDPRRCTSKKSDRVLRFEVLPGGGWDNLRNREMGILTNYNYSQCRTTEDGKFLIPDGIFTIPIKSSKVETYAELITHWDNFTSTLSRGVNVHAGLHFSHVGISGKFSDEYESVKSTQHFDKSMTTRVQVRYVQYTAKLEPDTKINDVFRARLRTIAAHITLNRTDLARYESQLLVRDFGTHVITSIDVGAALVQLDEVTATFVKKYESQKQQILASASASFFGIFDFGGGYSQSTSKTMIDEYRKQRTTSKIMTFGGPVFKPNNFTANNWSSSIYNDMVALDRSGDPIYYQITHVNLPDVPQSIVYDVYDYVKDAVHLYYEHNTHRGCTNEESPNFSFQANVDDDTCVAPKTNFTFGGVYQSCTGGGYTNLCAGMTQKNPQTGDFSCPDGYESVPLKQGAKNSQRQRRSCHSCWLLFHCCDTVTDTAHASYSAFWCAATGQVKDNSGFLFGGLFTSKMSNPLTQSMSCPPEFYPLKLLDTLTICVSDDYELGYRYSLPFAGFYSCKAGNPLALKEQSDLLQSSGRTSMMMTYMKKQGVTSYPHSCPKGYSQHLAIVDEGCSINYCIKTGALSAQGLPKVQRPPFMDAPKDGFTTIDSDSVVISSDGELWTSMEDADVMVPKFMAQHGMVQPSTEAPVGTAQYNSDSNRTKRGLSGGGIAAISISATLACVLIGTVIVITIRRRRNRGGLYRESDPWAGEGRNINPRSTRNYSNMEDNTPTVSTRT
ncbi:macrophage-expressed gene 1 protein-like [Ruditapes philippinarum]|uniref:macrophage-expressed gene 1 protein-like n=1 Tax=Ruditapes philippinarum TaxID=129788 RepID=UPI00295AF155|nr:macrophage-expressed gene 1 protein-like [Ruditapes philippinarum]